MKTSIDARDAELDTLTAMLDGGFIKIYSGSQPASPQDAESGMLLATLEFSTPAYESASGGTAVANSITEDSDASATGIAGWFRCYKSDGVTAVIDGTIGVDITMNSANIQQHTTVSISELPITLPQ